MTENSSIIEITEHNINDVLQRSMQTAVLLDFWAEWCEPCKTLAPILEKIVAEYPGRLILAKVDADAQPMIAQQLGVRGLPTLKLVVKGQLAGELSGAQPESEIRKMLEPHIGEPDPAEDSGDDFLGQINRARAMGAYQQAMEALNSAIQEHPKRWEYRAAYADVLMDQKLLSEAEEMISEIAEDSAKLKPAARLFFLNALQGAPEPADLIARLEGNTDDLEALYFIAIHMLLKGELEESLERFLDIMRKDRGFNEDAGRLALLKAFDFIEGSPLISKYRRKMFAFLH